MGAKETERDGEIDRDRERRRLETENEEGHRQYGERKKGERVTAME